MSTKYLSGIIGLLVACIINLAGAEGSLVVFDGGKNCAGSSWSDPPQITKFFLTGAEADGARRLRFEGEWKDYWAGGGWNWTNWQGPGSDVTSYGSLTVTFRKVEGEQLRDVWFQLADAANKTTPQVKLIEAKFLNVLPGEFTTVSIPLTSLTGGADLKTVCSLNIGFVPSSANGKGAIEISRIQFDPKK